jgi:hypothetical protein
VWPHEKVKEEKAIGGVKLDLAIVVWVALDIFVVHNCPEEHSDLISTRHLGENDDGENRDDYLRIWQ